MELAKDTRDRIFAAADSLYEQAGRTVFPTVDAVRKTAKVNMNDASAGMKEWRRAQTTQAAPVAVQVPEAVQQASGAALAALWQSAQELANESLRAAQAGWDGERAEADTLTRQMADAYETQAVELEAAQGEIARLKAAAEESAVGLAQLLGEMEDTRRELGAAKVAAERADARTVEIELRVADLRAELDHAHRDTEQARAAVTAAAGELDQVRGALAMVTAKAEAAEQLHQEQRNADAQEASRQAVRLVKAQTERDEAQKAAAIARERAAELTGKLEAVQGQNGELMAKFSPQVATNNPKAGKKA